MMIDLNACYAFDEDDGDDSGPGSSKEETPKRLLNNILYIYFNMNQNYLIMINEFNSQILTDMIIEESISEDYTLPRVQSLKRI